MVMWQSRMLPARTVWLYGLLLVVFLCPSCLSSQRQGRAYSEFQPPVVRPQQEQVVVQARRPISLSCEGHQPVTWHTPGVAPERVEITHGHHEGLLESQYSATVTIATTVFSDTGSYVCSFNSSSDLLAIDTNTAIHLYVYDEVHLLTQEAGGFDFQQSVQYQTAAIPCTPTHPDVTVQLELEGRGAVAVDNKYISYNPRTGFLISPVLPEHGGLYTCTASYGGKTSDYQVHLNVLPKTNYVPPPHINRTSGSHVTIGETLALTCSVSVEWSVMVNLDWQLPNAEASRPRVLLLEPVSRNVSIGGSFLKVVEQQLQLHRVDREDQGNYVCVVKDHSGNQQLKREYIRVYKRDQSFLRVWQDGYSTVHKTGGREDSVQWVIEMASLPGPPNVTWYDPDLKEIVEGVDKDRKVTTTFAKLSRSMLKLEHLQLEDSGEYKVKVDNGVEQKWLNFTVVVNQEPIVAVSVAEPSVMGLYQYGGHYTLRCAASGYPPPEITWSFRRCSTYGQCHGAIKHLPSTRTEKRSRVEMDSSLLIVASETGEYTCMGCNGQCQVAVMPFYVTTLPEGFQVSGPTRAVEGDSIELLCAASKYNYTDNSLAWFRQKAGKMEEIPNSLDSRQARSQRDSKLSAVTVVDDLPSKFDVGKKLRFSRVSPDDSGVYVCQAKTEGPKRRSNMAETTQERQLELRVQRLVEPHFTDRLNMGGEKIYVAEEGESLELRCKVEGVPQPQLTWLLDGDRIDLASRTTFISLDDGQSIRIPAVVKGRTAGEYSCVATSRAGESRLKQRVVQVEAPTILQTNLVAPEQTEQEAAEKIVEAGAMVNLTCRATGTPQPKVEWSLDGMTLEQGSRGVQVREGGQSLVLASVRTEQEGRYTCTVSNRGGQEVRHRRLRLRREGEAEGLMAGIALPLIVSASVALVLALILVILVRLCLTTCRSWKTPPSPPTPRLTQYELPEEGQETESCRLTLSRDGSRRGVSPSYAPSMAHSQAGCQGCGGCQRTCQQCSDCHYNYNGLYGCQGGSVLGVRGVEYPCHTPLSLPNSHSPGSQAMSELAQYSGHLGLANPGQLNVQCGQYGQLGAQYGQLGLLTTVPGGPLGVPGGPLGVPGGTLGRTRGPPICPKPLYTSDLRSDTSQISAEF